MTKEPQVESAPDRVTLADVKQDAQVREFLRRANEQLAFLGYTEHGQRHASLVANIAYNILDRLDHEQREAELAAMAGYLHDIGNVVHRENHAHASALIAMDVLSRLGMPYDEVALVMGAVGNHEEERGHAVGPLTAAVIIADKSDVHLSRVQNPDFDSFDIHDRVNHAAQRSFVRVNEEQTIIALEIDIDTEIASVMEYFEIFMSRMIMARKASEFLGCEFELCINDVRLY